MMETRALLIDERWGVNIPVRFYEGYKFPAWDLVREEYPDLQDSYADGYWDDWDALLSKAKHTDKHGKIWTLHHDEGLWALREDHDWEKELYG